MSLATGFVMNGIERNYIVLSIVSSSIFVLLRVSVIRQNNHILWFHIKHQQLYEINQNIITKSLDLC